MSQSFSCPKCGAPQDYQGGSAATIVCPYCDTTLIVPPELRTAAPEFGAFGASDWTREADSLKQVKALVDQGNKIAAIKLYRETFNVGLKEAKDAVEAIERGQSVQLARVMGLGQTISVNAGGEDFQISTSPAGTVQVSRNTRTASAGCIIAILAVVAVIVIASVALPLFFLGGVVSEFTDVIPPVTGAPLIAFASSTPAPTRTAIPTVTPTPGFARIAATFGKAGTAPGQFKDARHIALDNEGNVYVGEYSSGRIQRLNRQGEFQDQWTLEPEFPLRGLAADFLGNVYAVQINTITKFNGATGENLGTLQYANGDGFDDVWTLPDGGVLATWYENRSGFITSVQGNRDDLVRFDRNGNVTQVIEGVVSGQTGDPELDNRIAVDGLGNIYVLGGTFEDAVFKYSPDGKYISRFGSKGNEPGQFSSPLAIAADGQGRVYVADGNKIIVFGGDGRYIDTIDLRLGPTYGISFDSNDHLWVAANDKIYELALNK